MKYTRDQWPLLINVSVVNSARRELFKPRLAPGSEANPNPNPTHPQRAEPLYDRISRPC